MSKTKRQRDQTLKAFLLWLIPLAFLVAFFYRPLYAIFKVAFSPEFREGMPAFDRSKVIGPLLFTLKEASFSTIATLLLGMPLAWVFSHFEFRGRKALRTLSFIPFILPTVVVAAAFNALLGPRGWLNLALTDWLGLNGVNLQIQGSLLAIILAHVFYNISIVIRLVGSAWGRLNPRLGQAANSLGANPWRSFREVTFPLLRPSITAAALLVFLFDFTSFGVILMLGNPGEPTLEVAIYQQAIYYFNLPMAGMISAVQMSCTLLIAFLHDRSGNSKTGKFALCPETNILRKAKSPTEKAILFFSILFLVLMILTPLLSLAARSVVVLEAARGERGTIQTGFTVHFYEELFQNRTDSIFYVSPFVAILNSLKYSVATVLLTLILGLLIAYALVKQTHLNQWLLPLFTLPLGASAVTLGLGFVLSYNRPPWTAESFPLILPIAHTLIALPLVVRTLLPALRAIPPSLQESAAMLGAKPVRRWFEIDLPLLLRPLTVAAIFAFTISLGEFGATSFLSTQANPTLPIAIYRYLSQPGALNYGQAMAMATLLMVTCALGIFLIERVKLPGEELF